MKTRIKKMRENMQAPTPTKWKRIRNIAGTVAAVAGVLMFAPFSAAMLSVIGVVGGVAAIIAGTKTINSQDAQEMDTEALDEIRTNLIAKTFSGNLSDTEAKTLDTVKNEMKNRGLPV